MSTNLRIVAASEHLSLCARLLVCPVSVSITLISRRFYHRGRSDPRRPVKLLRRDLSDGRKRRESSIPPIKNAVAYFSSSSWRCHLSMYLVNVSIINISRCFCCWVVLPSFSLLPPYERGLHPFPCPPEISLRSSYSYFGGRVPSSASASFARRAACGGLFALIFSGGCSFCLHLHGILHCVCTHLPLFGISDW